MNAIPLAWSELAGWLSLNNLASHCNICTITIHNVSSSRIVHQESARLTKLHIDKYVQEVSVN